MADPLRAYRQRRDLDATPEPRGQAASSHEPPVFVIQEHRASTHHFDLRLETDEGVLASWAVPKGPSTDPGDKQLAIRVEDHPLDYADFEGTIPDDEYGAGSVIVWDIGPYQHRTEAGDGGRKAVSRAIADGHVTVWLEGHKLRGGYVLEQARVGGDDDNWLLIKVRDEGADARRKPTSTEPESVLSGRTLEQLGDDATDSQA